jgi:TRAP-type C4-dicarboxylate transport system permease small subunit
MRAGPEFGWHGGGHTAAVVVSKCAQRVRRMPGGDMSKGWTDRFIDGIELIAAVFIGIVAIDVFLTVVLRYFGVEIPDSYDLGMLLLAILIFWGIAATSFRGAHITVDLLWANVGPRWQRAIDVFATLVLLFVVAVHSYCLLDKVQSTYAANISTFSLRLPTWPAFAIAWLGDAAAVLLIAVRTWRLIFRPEDMARAAAVTRAVE